MTESSSKSSAETSQTASTDPLGSTSSMTNRAGTLRPSQIITVFGPGAIYDVPNDSIMIMGTDFWSKKHSTQFIDQRVLLKLQKINRFRNVKSFRTPSFSGTKGNVSVMTFPSWGECPECHKLTKRNGHPDRLMLTCPDCRQSDGESPHTHPVRLIVACRNGHIDDFPWFEWIRHNRNNCGRNNLYLEEGAQTVSLAGLAVSCHDCGARRSLGSALSEDGLKSIPNYYCTGRRPWLRDNEPCNEEPRGLLKGASNVYFSSTLRALSIPPFEHPLRDFLEAHWSSILALRNKRLILESLVESIMEQNQEMAKKYEKNDVMTYIDSCFEATDKSLDKDIKEDEWMSLTRNELQDTNGFATEIIFVPDKYEHIFDKLVIVRRLRETVVLKGFARIDSFDPEDLNPPKLASISSDDPEWLPAVENHGEGIFISFKEKLIADWERLPAVLSRNNQIVDQHNRIRTHRGMKEVTIDPRFIFLHTMSHILIRELSNFAGYSSSSIRERIYGQNGMAGILLYTSSASSDGSLGGLVGIGKSLSFKLILDGAIRKSKLCSSDPFCAMHDPSSTGRNNGAACHACSFLPETSCINMNTLLDRSMVHSTIAKKTNRNSVNISAGLFDHALSD